VTGFAPENSTAKRMDDFPTDRLPNKHRRSLPPWRRRLVEAAVTFRPCAYCGREHDSSRKEFDPHGCWGCTTRLPPLGRDAPPAPPVGGLADARLEGFVRRVFEGEPQARHFKTAHNTVGPIDGNWAPVAELCPTCGEMDCDDKWCSYRFAASFTRY
jgi:hypothetical protein